MTITKYPNIQLNTGTKTWAMACQVCGLMNEHIVKQKMSLCHCGRGCLVMENEVKSVVADDEWAVGEAGEDYVRLVSDHCYPTFKWD